ncbi:LysM peptidoglycan-binding domain-containing protein [Shewanella seohaensis]|uniref:LysM peptidoglycan-binding domain-containing protein n=1 Tax=Shewanella seohaensis TaxID=755175 RepID=A0ABV4VXQ8_9GAMM
MFKKLILLMPIIYSVAGYTTEYEELFYITPKLDFVNELNSEDSSDFGIGYALDIDVPLYKFVSFDNTIRYIDWNSGRFHNNFLQYGALLKLNIPFTDKTNFAVSGGFLADIDIGNEARDKEVNPYVKFNVDYNINNNWAVVIGFNQSFSSNYLDQYAFSLGVKYLFYKEKRTVGHQHVRDNVFTEDKIEKVKELLPEELKVVNPIVEEVSGQSPVNKGASDYTRNYVIKEGDFIYQICRQFNMSLGEFMEINKGYFTGRDLNYVYPGEVVKVIISK